MELIFKISQIIPRACLLTLNTPLRQIRIENERGSDQTSCTRFGPKTQGHTFFWDPILSIVTIGFASLLYHPTVVLFLSCQHSQHKFDQSGASSFLLQHFNFVVGLDSCEWVDSCGGVRIVYGATQ